MAFRYLIYRTDYGNTVVRESASSGVTGNEVAFFTDFVIPANQPLYLWKYDTGDIVPNNETNINNWVNFVNPPSGDSPVDYFAFTGYTASTNTTINGIEDDIVYLSGETNGKLDKVVAVTGNVPVFGASGNTLLDSGYDIADLIGGVTGGTPIGIFTGYTASTETRLSGIEDDIVYLSGQTAGKVNTTLFNGYTGATDTRIDGIEDDIVYLSGETASKVSNTKFNSYTGATDTRIDGIEDDIVYLSGQTNLKLNITDFNVYSAATKVYIDSAAAGLDPKASVRVATISAITGTYVPAGGTGGSGSFTGVSTTVIDGITLVNGNRILVKNQADPKQNGIYVRISSTVWERSSDMDGTPSSEVSGGAYVFVETGTTMGASGWVLDGDGVLALNVDPLIWSQFSAANSYVAGVGITINGNTIALNGGAIAGNNLDWDGSQLNVQITGGTLGAALDGKVDDSTFNTYTGATETRLSGIEDDIVYLSGETASKVSNSKFNTYTGATETRLSGIEDDIVYLSGETASKVSNTKFNSYTGATDTRINGIEDDIVYLSGQTDTKLDISLFTGYTATTKSDEIHLIRTGATGIDINTITPTAIVWNGQLKSSTVFSWTGGSGIFVNATGEYEITYNVPVVHTGTNNVRSYGSNIIVNNATVIDRTFAGVNTSRADAVGNLALPSVVVSLTSGTRLDLVAFRSALAGTTNTRPDATILIKKKNTLQ